GSSAFQQRQECTKGVASIQQHLAADGQWRILEGGGCGRNIAALPVLLEQVAARASNGEPFVVEQALDLQHGLNVLAAVEPMALRTFHRLQRGELALPVAQDKGFGGGEPADFADAEEALFGDYGSGLAVAWHSRLSPVEKPSSLSYADLSGCQSSRRRCSSIRGARMSGQGE